MFTNCTNYVFTDLMFKHKYLAIKCRAQYLLIINRNLSLFISNDYRNLPLFTELINLNILTAIKRACNIYCCI